LSYLANIRQKQHSRGLRALGLFVAVWLNLALQPCAMAFEADDDHDCPHCPPAQTQEHGGMHGNMDNKMPCADGLSDCAIVEDLNVDGRGGQFKLKDAPVDTFLAIAPQELAQPFHQLTSATLHRRHTSVHAGASPPFYVLNCVYLK